MIGLRRYKLALAIGFCAAGASLVGVPAAWAGAGDDAHVEVIRETGVAAGAISEAPVQCPSGERAIGGGVLTDSGNSPMGISADGPLDETGLTANTEDGDVPRYWYSAIANGYPGPQTYTHYAICSASSDATLQANVLLLPSPNGAGPTRLGQSSYCPDGSRAISGGFGSSDVPSFLRRAIMDQPLVGDGSLVGTTTGSVPTKWYFFGENDSAEWLVKVFAVCSASSQVTVQATSFDAETPVQAAAPCPGTGRATGGGFGATNDVTSSYWLSTSPTTETGAPASSDGDVPRGWFGRVDATAASGTYRVYAVCEPGPPNAGTSAPTGQRAAALKKCKKKHSKKARKKCRRKALRLPA